MVLKKVRRRLGDVMIAVGLALCALAITITLSAPANAQNANTESQRGQGAGEKDPWLGGNWQLGAIGKVESNPYRGADSTDLNGLPLIAYDAERMHIGTDEVDIKVWKNDFASVSFIGGLRGAPFDPDDSSYLNGMEDPDMGYDIGMGFATRLWRGELVGKYLTDVTDTHDGHEVDFSYSVPVQWGHARFKWGAGVTWQSENLVDYGAGVARNEVRADRAYYAPDATFLPHLDLSVAYPLTENLNIIGTGGVVYLSDEYTDSPIIDDDYVLSAGLGLVYTF